MARQIFAFEVITPQGTTRAAPLTTPLVIPPRRVDEIEIVVPPGPSGNLGFAVAVSGVPVIPYNADEWIVTDNEKLRWPLADYADSGAWSLVSYNTDVNAHRIYIRLLTSLVSPQPAGAPTPIPADQLSGVVLPSIVVG